MIVSHNNFPYQCNNHYPKCNQVPVPFHLIYSPFLLVFMIGFFCLFKCYLQLSNQNKIYQQNRFLLQYTRSTFIYQKQYFLFSYIHIQYNNRCINKQLIYLDFVFQTKKEMLSSPQSNQLTRQADMRLAEIEKEIYKKIDIGHQIANLLNKQKKSPINESLLQTQQNNQKFTYDDIERLEPPPFMHGVNYYDFVWKTFVKNQILIKQVKSIADKNKSLQNVITEIQRLTQEYYRFYKLKNRKKNRRLAIQIEKNFTCPYQNCHKIYGSDVSLNLHIKLKHNGGNKTDREKLAEQICQAQEKGEPMPELTLNLPPGYLNEYKKLYFQRDLYNQGEIIMQQPHQYIQQQLDEQKSSKREKK